MNIITVIEATDVGDGNNLVIDNGHKRVILISLDGFGKEYLKRYPGLGNLAMLYKHGSHPAKYKNVFVTKTFPNHFTIATGVYEETHGVIGNTVYDPSLKRNLTIKDAELFTQNAGVIPIWTLNELAGGHSGCVAWPGCPFTYAGRNVTYWEPYNHSQTLQEKMDNAVWWMNNVEKPANLVMIYHDQPDWVGHVYGPDSPMVQKELLKIDSALKYLHDKLKSYGLLELVDLVVLSDHGMSAVPESQIIHLNKFENLQKHNFFYMGASPVLNIWPSQGTEILDLYATLDDGCKSNNCTVMLNSENTKHNIPSEWHYARNPRVSRITLLADEGYVFEDFDELVQNYKNTGYPNLTNIHGDHGYPVEDPSMEPIFVASGPSFKRGYEAPEFSSVDVYSLLCEILSLNAPPNNGSLPRVEHILAKPIIGSLLKPLIIALIVVVLLVAVIGTVACSITRNETKRPSADTLINGYVYRRTISSPSGSEDMDQEKENLLEDGEYEEYSDVQL